MNNSSPACSQWPHRPQACFILVVVSRSSLCLSTLGSLLVILFMTITKKYKIFVQKLVLALAINTFLYSVALVMTSSGDISDSSSTTCVAYAMLMQYFTLTLLLWVFVITIHISMRVYNSGNLLSKYFFRAVCPAVLTIPLLPTFLLLTGDYYGPAGMWCWIKKGNDALRFGIFYIPLFASGSIEIVLYVLIVIKVYKMTKPLPRDSRHENLNNTRYREEVRPLLLFPIIYLCLYIPITVYRVDEALNPALQPNFPLAVLSAILASSNGLINSIVYLALLTDRKELSIAELSRAMKTTFCCRQEDAVEHGVEVFSQTMAPTETRGQDM